MKKLCMLLGIILTVLLAGCGKAAETPVEVRVGSMYGATSLGMLSLMDKAEKGDTADRYSFSMYKAADQLTAPFIQKELDIVLVPANVAAVLYAKTEGQIQVIDINTLGVLYLVTGDASVTSLEDLRGRTVYLTGKGTTPEASLRYLLDTVGVGNECTLEFKSEASEVAAVLAQDSSAVGLLPQPFVTAACMQNAELSVVVDLNREWEKVSGSGQGMVTGVTVVRKEFLEQNPEAVKRFLEEHRESVAAVLSDADTAAGLAVAKEIVAKEPIAKAAIPKCNLVCLTGEEMKTALSDYLSILYRFDAKLVGGALPAEAFYYITE